MNDFKGTKTEKNILEAFKGESQARNRYSFFEEQARKEGNEDVAKMFEKMARNEMIHARLWFNLLYGNTNGSASNLQTAAQGEHEEWHSMYPQFAADAREEGLEHVAKMFEQVAEIEKDHEHTFLKAFVALQDKDRAAEAQKAEEAAGTQKPVYRCMFCGAMFEKRPDVCSVCGAIGSFEAGMA